jgi:hypothetical protein
MKLLEAWSMIVALYLYYKTSIMHTIGVIYTRRGVIYDSKLRHDYDYRGEVVKYDCNKFIAQATDC